MCIGHRSTQATSLDAEDVEDQSATSPAGRAASHPIVRTVSPYRSGQRRRATKNASRSDAMSRLLACFRSLSRLLPSSQKQLQANKKNRTEDFLSVGLRMRKRKIISGTFFLFRECDVLLGLVRAQHDHYESKCERQSGGTYLACHCEIESEQK